MCRDVWIDESCRVLVTRAVRDVPDVERKSFNLKKCMKWFHAGATKAEESLDLNALVESENFWHSLSAWTFCCCSLFSDALQHFCKCGGTFSVRVTVRSLCTCVCIYMHNGIHMIYSYNVTRLGKWRMR